MSHWFEKCIVEVTAIYSISFGDFQQQWFWANPRDFNSTTRREPGKLGVRVFQPFFLFFFYPQATLAYCKHLWDSNGKNERDHSLVSLQYFVRKEIQPRCSFLTAEANAARNSTAGQVGQPNTALVNQAANETLFAEEKECRQLLARCYLR